MTSPGSWRWGIDIGERKLAIGMIRAEERTWAVSDPGPRTNGVDLAADLSDLRARTYTLVSGLGHRYPPEAVTIESPSGGFRNARLESAFGVITEAVYSAFSDHHAGAPPILKVSSSKWKKRCLGLGTAKPDRYLAEAIKEFGEQIPRNHDVAAALWLARYAWTLELR